MRMSLRAALLLLLLPFAAGAMAGDAAQDPAEAAARVWLAAADRGDGSETWKLAAPLFQDSIPAAQWQQKLTAARSPLGPLKARKLSSTTRTSRLPGAPDGAYVVLRFDSQFEHKAGAVETVTAMQQPDGSWRVAGYYIH